MLKSCNKVSQQEIQSAVKKPAEKKNGIIDDQEYLNFLNQKITLCRLIYQLLIDVCKYNSINQVKVYELIPFFQVHAKYIKEAIDCIIEVCKYNYQILEMISDTLKIDFNYEQEKIIEVDNSGAIKILINLYEGEEAGMNKSQRKEERIQFRQHDKIITKPVNLITYFINLL